MTHALDGDHSHAPAAIRARLLAGASPGYLRDWIYGAIDGAVTTFAIVAGVIGADLSVGVILVLGAANLLADGFSMAAANYSGTRAEHEERRRLTAIERRHIRTNPEGERQEIREIYRAKGFSGEDLERVVAVISADEGLWVEAMLVEEYGQSPVLRSPWAAGGVTFVAFLIAGLAPLAPFALDLPFAERWAIGLTGAVFFLVGAVKSRWTLAHWAWAGAETLLIGGTAAAVAFGVGRLFQDVL